MTTLTIGGQQVQVDNSFMSMSPADQQKAVEEIASQLSSSTAPAQPTDQPPPGAVPGSQAYKTWAIARAKAGKTLPPVGPQPNDPMHSGPVANASAGINDVIATTLGAPVDLARTAINASTQPNSTAGFVARNLPLFGPIMGATQALSSAAGVPAIPDTAFGGRRSIINAMSSAGITDPDTVQARSTIDRIVRASASGATAMIAPEAMVGLLGRAGIVGPQAAEIMAQVFGKSDSLPALIGNTVAGAASGAGSQTAQEVAPDSLKPLAGVIGGFGGAGAGTLLTGVPRLAAAATRMAGDYMAPITDAGRQSLVGRQLVDAATSPGDAMDTIANAPASMVPGSMPTTGQLTGDMGLLGLERTAQTQNPVPFLQRAADQNAARLSALEGLQPGSSPDQVVGAVRSYLADIDSQLTQSLDAARGTAQRANSALGAGTTPDIAGADLRSTYEAARADAKTNEAALWKAVDPTGKLTLAVPETRSQAGSIIATTPTTAKPPSAEEAAIFQAAKDLPATAKLSDITALQSRIKEEMRTERMANGETAAWRRLSQLNGAVQNDLEGAISTRVAQDQRAVSAGQMSPEDTMAARFQQVVDAWKAERDQVGQVTGQAVGGSNAVQAGAARNRPVSAGNGSERSPGWRPGNVAGIRDYRNLMQETQPTPPQSRA